MRVNGKTWVVLAAAIGWSANAQAQNGSLSKRLGASWPETAGGIELKDVSSSSWRKVHELVGTRGEEITAAPDKCKQFPCFLFELGKGAVAESRDVREWVYSPYVNSKGGRGGLTPADAACARRQLDEFAAWAGQTGDDGRTNGEWLRGNGAGALYVDVRDLGKVTEDAERARAMGVAKPDIRWQDMTHAFPARQPIELFPTISYRGRSDATCNVVDGATLDSWRASGPFANTVKSRTLRQTPRGSTAAATQSGSNIGRASDSRGAVAAAPQGIATKSGGGQTR